MQFARINIKKEKYMATNWKAQIGDGKFCVQFETSNYKLYHIVEKACQKAVTLARKGIPKVSDKRM